MLDGLTGTVESTVNYEVCFTPYSYEIMVYRPNYANEMKGGNMLSVKQC